MPRIVIAECKQEVSSFNPSPSVYDDFRVVTGEKLIEHHRGGGQEVGGALRVLDPDTSVTLLPAFGASANTSGGILCREGFERLSREFLEQIAAADSPDAAYISLHGAMQAEGEDDPEGYLLEETRRIIGPRVPLVASLDLHGVLTDRMLRQCDAVVAYHTYPHVDFVQTGMRAAKVLLRILNEGARPVTARVRIPALVRGDELITETGAIRHCVQRSQQMEADPAGLSVAVMWGNPFTDVPELQTNSFAVVDDDEDLARAWALELANLFWRDHAKMQVPLTSLEESVRLASQVQSGTVVMMDAADATSSGASGDSNAIVAEILRQGYKGRVLAPIVDPAAVRRAFEAGVGSVISTRLGGALDHARFTPLPVEARVRSLSDGRFQSESFGWPWDSGDTAVLEVGNITFVVGTRPVSLFDRSWFYANGQNPRRFDVVIVKSPHCEHHMFAEWCTLQLNVDAPGSTSANLPTLGHKKCPRPMFPLDGEISFEPVVEIYSRR